MSDQQDVTDPTLNPADQTVTGAGAGAGASAGNGSGSGARLVQGMVGAPPPCWW
jgi:hypothetical protein